jgi:hypothetical protein
MASDATAGDETLVNDYTTSGQNVAVTTGLADGGWVVSWYGEGAGDSSGIFQQRYAADGNAVGSETLVNTYTTGLQYASTITGLSNGGWLVTWEGEAAGNGNFGIFQQRYAANGHAVGSEITVNSYTESDQYAPTITDLVDGGWVVTWWGQGPGEVDNGIFQQRYAANGDTVGSETVVNSYTTNGQNVPTTTGLTDGGWVVTWRGEGTGDSAGIFQQRYAANGAAVGSETLVNSYTTGIQNNPTTTDLTDGGWVVTWWGEGPGDSSGIYQQRYAANGHTVGAETLVNSDTANSQGVPTATGLSDGGWVVTWVGEGPGDSDGVFEQRYAANGHKVGSETLVNSYTTGNQYNPTTTALDDGSWVVTWWGNGPGDSGGVFQRHFAPDVDGSKHADTLNGTDWGENLFGYAGKDVLTGGKGNDKLYGGGDSDHFVFHNGNGADTIVDFDAKGSDHDIVDLSHISGLRSFADLEAHNMYQDGSSVVIDFAGHDTITLEGVKIKDLSAADFYT